MGAPLNIPLGTQVDDGLRSGPIWDTITTDVNNNVYASNYSQYGPAMLYMPAAMVNIVPYTSVAGGICAAQAVAAAGNMNFNPAAYVANSSCTLLQDSTGANYIQFDWPRTIQMTVAGAAMTAATNVTVFGYDWYGYPLQETQVANAAGNVNFNKAFFSVTRVYCNGTTGAGGTLALQTQDEFGLPYWLGDLGGTLSFGYNGAFQAAAAINADVTVGLALTAASGAATADIRGTVNVGGIAACNGALRLFFSFYVQGADQNLNIWNNIASNNFANYISVAQQSQNFTQLLAGARAPVPPLTEAMFYGVPQYYTGVPA